MSLDYFVRLESHTLYTLYLAAEWSMAWQSRGMLNRCVPTVHPAVSLLLALSLGSLLSKQGALSIDPEPHQRGWTVLCRHQTLWSQDEGDPLRLLVWFSASSRVAQMDWPCERMDSALVKELLVAFQIKPVKKSLFASGSSLRNPDQPWEFRGLPPAPPHPILTWTHSSPAFPPCSPRVVMVLGCSHYP